MKTQGFMKSSAILLGMVIITKVLGLIYKIPLTQILGGSGMGYFSAAYSVFTPIFAVVVSGITSSVARLTAENYALGRYSNLRRQKRRALLIFGLVGLIACLLIIICSGLLSEYVVREPAVKYSLICVAPSIFFCAVMSVERGYYEGLRNMLPTALSEITETVFRVIFGLGLAMFTADYGQRAFAETGKCFGVACGSSAEAAVISLPFVSAAAILGSSAASGIACLYIIVSTKIHGDGITKSMLREDPVTDSFRRTAGELFSSCLPLSAAAVISTLTGMIDMLTVAPCLRTAVKNSPESFSALLSAGISAEELPNFMYGSYTGLALLIYGLVPTLTAMLGKSVLPALADARARKNSADFSAQLDRMMSVSAIIAIPSGLGIFVLSRQLLEFLFGSRTAEIQVAELPLKILGVGVIFCASSIACFTVLQTMGKASQCIAVMTAGSVLKLLLNIVLIRIPQINICGGAIAETLSDMLIFIYSVRATYRLAGVRCRVTEIYIKPFYSGIMCALTARLVRDILTEQSFFTVNHRIITLSAIAAGCIIYVISLYLLCETPKNLFKYVFSKKNEKST